MDGLVSSGINYHLKDVLVESTDWKEVNVAIPRQNIIRVLSSIDSRYTVDICNDDIRNDEDRRKLIGALYETVDGSDSKRLSPEDFVAAGMSQIIVIGYIPKIGQSDFLKRGG